MKIFYDSYIRLTFSRIKLFFLSFDISIKRKTNFLVKMTDQRFKYYTGYEVDNEPSEDEDDLPCNTAITNGNVNSDR